MPNDPRVNKFRALKCRKCGGTDVHPTSSQQFRQVRGKRRQVVDLVCVGCGHQWWSTAAKAKLLARQADLARVQDATQSGKRVALATGMGLPGRRHVRAASAVALDGEVPPQ